MRRALWIIYLIIAVVTLPVIIYLARTAQQYITRAAPTPANIVVDASVVLSDISKVWEAFGQGGEEPPPALKQVTSDMRSLNPRYIRIDHIYDHYEILQQSGSSWKLNFTKLDDTVNDIVSMGAIPFLSLSYFPPALTTDGEVTSLPKNWNDWEQIVKATVEHYSGKRERNLVNVYYEVWNEPDYFGKWQIGGEKDYRLLYFHSVNGASQAVNTNPYFFGGPAITNMITSWSDGFLKYVVSNNLRLDFFSWHRYTKDPEVFAADAAKIREVLKQYPRFSTIPLLITEWGIDSENNSFYDNTVSASYTISSIRKMLDLITLGFAFEIKDGPDPAGKQYWGRWGLITHNTKGLVKKPRYFAFRLLTQMRGKRVSLTGEGSNVTGFSTLEAATIRIILSNYDTSSLHSENVPVQVKGLVGSSYTVRTTYLNGSVTTKSIVPVSNSIAFSVPMKENEVVLLEVSRVN